MECIKRVKTLPEDVVDHPHLQDATELDLSGSLLVSLPKRFGECKSLTKLDLSFCKNLESLPDRFGECKSLTSLNLEYCSNLVSLPDRFGECKSLTFLNLHLCPAGENMPEALKAQLKNQGCSGSGW